MKILREQEIKKIYKWDFEDVGWFEATITNGELEDVSIGKVATSIGMGGFHTRDLEFLKAIYQALGELFKILEKNKK